MIVERRSSPWPGTARCPGECRSRRHPRRTAPARRPMFLPCGWCGTPDRPIWRRRPVPPGPCLRPSGSIRPPREWPTPQAVWPEPMPSCSPPGPSRPPPSQRRGLRGAGAGQGNSTAVGLRAPFAAAGVAHVGYPAGRPHPRAFQARPAGRALRGTTSGPGAAHPADRRLAGLGNWTPGGSAVVLDAEHTCMTLRGVQAVGTRTVTSALRGLLRNSPPRGRSSSP